MEEDIIEPFMEVCLNERRTIVCLTVVGGTPFTKEEFTAFLYDFCKTLDSVDDDFLANDELVIKEA